MPKSAPEREAAPRACRRLYRDPEYAEATVPVLLRQLDAARAELTAGVEQMKANIKAMLIADENLDILTARAEAAEARVAELEQALRSAEQELDSDDKFITARARTKNVIHAALAKEPPR